MAEPARTYAVVICTYKRHASLVRLLHSLTIQTRLPERVVIVDASDKAFETGDLYVHYPTIEWAYHLVSREDRGLTRQRNLGIAMCREDVIVFLDDDVVLDARFLETLAAGYAVLPDAIGIGGYVQEDNAWAPAHAHSSGIRHHCFDGWCQQEHARIIARKLLGLSPPAQPCTMPPEGHGRSIGSLPPTGKMYPVEYFMGCAMSFRRSIFARIQFSTYFEGYGLYEDLHFCLQALQHGSLFVHTGATIEHHHEPGGRPAALKYGRMVSRNGWYVWRVKWPEPSLSAVARWWCITLLLLVVRVGNSIGGPDRLAALYESVGRLSGLLSILVDPPHSKPVDVK